MEAVVVDNSSVNQELPIAIVKGQSFLTLPKDLYIPPEALQVFLEAFEGPLDLLLYLIKRQNLDILDIPIADITKQYLAYIELMHGLKFELAAEYLLMAAMLAEIKSRMLLPKPKDLEEEEGDPRAELVRRLQEYERFKMAAQNLEQLPCEGRDFFPASVEIPAMPSTKPIEPIDMRELVLALQEVMQRAQLMGNHQIRRDTISVREKMTQILERINHHGFSDFTDLFTLEEGRLGVVVTFLAILELLRQAIIELVQNECYSAIHIRHVQ